MVDWDCVNGYGSDEDCFSYESEVPGCLKDVDIPQNTKRSKSNRHSDTTCPKCGAKTVKREGPFGSFYGCVKFPSCKGTINI